MISALINFFIFIILIKLILFYVGNDIVKCFLRMTEKYIFICHNNKQEAQGLYAELFSFVCVF